MLLSRFTVLCPCGVCLRGIHIVHAMILANHRAAQLFSDDGYDALLAETLADAEAVLEC